MKLKKALILSEMDGKYIAVAADDAREAFSGMVKLNKRASFIAEKMRTDTTVDALVEALQEEYNVTEKRARQNVTTAVNRLCRINLIDE